MSKPNPAHSDPDQNGLIRKNLAIYTLFVVLVVLSLLPIAIFFDRMQDYVSSLSPNRPENTPWSLGQVEVDYLRLKGSMSQGLEASADLEAIRLRFDIFYSRVDVLANSQTYAVHRETDAFVAPLGVLTQYLSDNVAVIDGNDAQLRMALTGFINATDDISESVRAVSLAGLRVATEQAGLRREEISGLMFWHAVLTLLALGLLFLVIAGLLRLQTVRRRAHRSAAQARSRFEAIVQSSSDGIILCDATGKVVEMNRPAQLMFGHNVKRGKDIRLQHLLRGCGQKDMNETTGIQDVPKERIETQGIRADGSEFPAEVSLTKTRFEENSDIFVAFVRDISKRVNAERALRTAHDAASASAKAKSDLLAIMSHETRTPLNGILGAAELLHKVDGGEKHRNLVSAIETSARLLLQHMNDVLDVSRHDAGEVDMQVAPFDLRAMLTDLVNSQTARAAQNGNRLSFDLGEDIPDKVIGDEQKIRQVLLNLISNAIKFTENGVVVVEIETISDGPFLEIRVIDSGAGIEARQLERVFEDFYRSDNSYARQREGTGLGLGIVKRLIEAMGGEVGAESVLGEGSLFWIRLPLLQKAEAKSSRKIENAKPKSFNILLVEDNAINRMITCEMLKNLGHRVSLAESGHEGAMMAGDEGFDLIFMDISMPGMDGIETTSRIRASGGLSENTPIIALTAHSRREDLSRLRASGMQHILTKPVSESALEAMILKVLGDVFLSGTSHAIPAPRESLLNDEMVESVLRNVGLSQAEEHHEELRHDMRALLQSLAGCQTADELDLAELHRMAGATAIMGMARLRTHLAKAETIELADPQDLQRWIAAAEQLWHESDQALALKLDAANRPQTDMTS